MKKFTYNGQEYEVQERTYEYNGGNFNCLYIKSDDFECVIEDMSIDVVNDDSDFETVMETEYLVTDENFLKLVR